MDLQFLGEHGHLKPSDAQGLHSVMMRGVGVTEPDEIVADWSRRDPEAPWGSNKAGAYVRELTEMTFLFMIDKIQKAGGPVIELDPDSTTGKEPS